ncbi:AraC family transcriptional regulator [Paenibacillus yanchengensis]|uniref:AraC family transcriptional regulator n=1 Tax=Paenibacillus yanchengensis TaxID=2035833 RepID=A0ABW4YLT2_9BACL
MVNSWNSLRKQFKHHFFRRSLFLILSITCLPLMIASLGVYFIGTEQIEKTVMRSHQSEVQLTVQRMDDFFSHLEKMIIQWAFHTEFGSDLRILADEYNYEYIRKVFNSLLLIKGVSPIVKQVFLYEHTAGVLLSEDGGLEKLYGGEQEQYAKWLNGNQSAVWALSDRWVCQQNCTDIAFIYKLSSDTNEPHALLVTVLDQERVASLIGSNSMSGLSYIVDKQGGVIQSGGSLEANQDNDTYWTQLALDNWVGKSGLIAEPSVLRKNEENYSFINFSFPRPGGEWNFVSVVPMKDLLSPVIFLAKFIFIISLIAWLVMVILAVLASNRLYQPIHSIWKLVTTDKKVGEQNSSIDVIAQIRASWNQLYEHSTFLQESVNNNRAFMRNSFLLQLLQGNFYMFNEVELREKMTNLDWEVDTHQYTIIIIQLTGISSRANQYSEKDIQLFTFAAANIAEESCKQKVDQIEVVNFQNLSLAILIVEKIEDKRHNHEEMQAYQKNSSKQLTYQLTNDLHQLLQLDVTAVLSRTVENISLLPQVFAEANRRLNYREASGGNQVLIVQESFNNHDIVLSYPFSTENKLLQAIYAMDNILATRLLEQFCDELISSNGKQFLFHQGIQQLLGNLRYGFLKGGFDPYRLHADADLYEQLSTLKDTPDIVSWFTKHIIAPFIKELQGTKSHIEQSVKEQIASIITYVESNYADTSLSLELCADQIMVSPLTLSRLFKKTTGYNFVDYVTRFRLEKSKELLQNSRHSIQEIAVLSGYQATYFNRIFKKYEGVTPGQYRQFSQQ